MNIFVSIFVHLAIIKFVILKCWRLESLRKIILLTSLFLLSLFLIACGGGDDAKSKGKNKLIEASVEDGKFILPTKEGEYDPDDNTGIVVLDINIQNKSKESIDIFPEQNMALYDDNDVQIDPKSIIDSSLDIDILMNTSVGGEKQKTFPVAFEVERDKVYDMSISSLSANPEHDTEEVTLEVDMNEYSDTYEALNEPAEVLQEFIETVYFDQKHDDIDESIDIDVEEQIDKARKGYVDFLEDATFADVSGKVASKYYDDFIDALNENGHVDVKLKGSSGEKATLEVHYSAFSAMDLGDDFRDYRKKYLEKSSSYDTDAADEHALSKLDDMLKNLKVKESRNPLQINMKKTDGKWSFEDNYGDPVREMREAFAEGRIF